MWTDLRHGVRMLVKNPGFSVVAILSIAVGVGANAAMFSLADGLVLRPLSVPRAGEIVELGGNGRTVNENAGFAAGRGVSYPDYVDVRDRARSFAGLFAYQVVVTGFARDARDAARSQLGLAVSGNFFDVLEVRPALGRSFRADEDVASGRNDVLVLSHETWTERFSADPGIVDTRVRLGGRDFTVVGVAPASFNGMHLVLHPAYYVPLTASATLAGVAPGLLEIRDARRLAVKGRLSRGVSLTQAQQEADIIAAGLAATYPATNRDFGFLVRSDFAARLEERGPATPGALLLLSLAVVVLLVACANVAGLLTSRAPARTREIAVRMAIGGGRRRVFRQLLTEGALLAGCGAAVGLLVAWAALSRSRGEVVSDIGVRLVVDLDRRALAVGLVAAVASALLSSLVPAWRVTRARDLTASLRPGLGASNGRSRLWGRHGLVVGQVALSMMMLLVAVFVYRGFVVEFQQPGFRTDRMLLVSLNPDLAGYDESRTESFYEQLVARVRAMPSVQSVGLTSVVPLNQDNRNSSVIVPEGYELPRGTDTIAVSSARIDEGYLDTMAIPLLRGRTVRRSDTADAPLVVVVNQTLAARYWPNQEAIGKRLRLRGADGPWAEVVGVAADSKYNFISEAPTPFLYLPWRQGVLPSGTLLVSTSGPSTSLTVPLRRILQELDSGLPTSPVRTMEAFFSGSAVSVVLGAIRMVAGMGVTGMALALVGLYSLMAYAVAQRTREIGVRMAIGADPGSVLRMVLRHGGALAVGGIGIGVVGSVAVGGLLRGILPNRAGIDLTSYLLVVPALVAITLLAAYLPARRAARIDPLVALRQE